jgi:alkaline phosphatase D
MRLTRRSIVLGIPAFTLACSGPTAKESADSADSAPPPTPEREPEPAAWDPGGTEDPVAFAWGVQSGDAGSDRVILSLRCVESTATLVVVEAQGDSWVEVQRQEVSRNDETWQGMITGLKADTAYRYAFFAADGQHRSRVGRFRTAPEPGVRRKLVIGATSCLGGNEPWANLSFAADAQLDVMLMLGDVVYADGAVTLEDYRSFYRHAFGVKGLQDVSASTSMIATWDDHEVGNNWTREDLAEGQFEAALQAFRESMPQGQGAQGQIWRMLSFGDMVDFFVLDCRSERTETLYISVEQMEWLKAALTASKARFKLILNSVPINDYTDMFGIAYADDRWQGYPEQRREILDFVVDQAIGGVLWVAGDVHHGMICHPDAPGDGSGDSQWEVAAGPSGSTLNVAAELYTDTTGHYPVLFAKWNYTRLTMDPGTGSCLVSFIGDDGLVIEEMELFL